MSTLTTSAPQLEGRKVSKSLGFVQRHPVVTYFVLTLALSWLIELPLIVQVQGWADLRLPLALHYLASSAPPVAQVTKMAASMGPNGMR